MDINTKFFIIFFFYFRYNMPLRNDNRMPYKFLKLYTEKWKQYPRFP